MTGLGISINEKLHEEFSKLVDDSGYTKYRAVEGAIRAFMAMPSEAQVSLMNNNVDAHKLLSETFQNVVLEEHLQKLSPQQKSQIFAVVKEAATKLSRKK